MAKQTLEKLIKGHQEILSAYQHVKEKWDEILTDFDFKDENAVEKMAELVATHQLGFEHVAGERWLGQEIMVIVGIGQFYSSEIGFDASLKEAKTIYNGFLTSMCSLEVKSHAETIGSLYRIKDYLEEDLNF